MTLFADILEGRATVTAHKFRGRQAAANSGDGKKYHKTPSPQGVRASLEQTDVGTNDVFLSSKFPSVFWEFHVQLWLVIEKATSNLLCFPGFGDFL